MSDIPSIKFPRTRDDCIRASSDTEDGTYIAGHTFVTLIAFEDESTSRWYMVDICADCGTPSAMFTDKYQSIEMAKEYPNIARLGGEPHA